MMGGTGPILACSEMKLHQRSLGIMLHLSLEVM